MIIKATPIDLYFLLDKGWSIVEQDERSLKLNEVNISNIDLKTCLKEGETNITGVERLKRLEKENYIRLDARFLESLWQNTHLIPEDWKSKIVYFYGTILKDQDSYRWALYLCHDKYDWHKLLQPIKYKSDSRLVAAILSD